MKTIKRIFAALLILFLAFLSIPATITEAASKKTVYVVDKVEVKEGNNTYTLKPTYKDGFFKKIEYPDPEENATETFTYNSKHHVTKHTLKITSGAWKGFIETRKNTYDSDSLLKKRTETRTGGDKDTITFTIKDGRQTKKKVVSVFYDEDGKKITDTYTATIKYKNGNISKIKSDGWEYNFTYDDKGNMTRSSMKNRNGEGRMVTNPDFYYKAKITYDKNGRIKKLVTKRKNPMMDNEEALNMKFTYKKISVNKKYVKAIEAQQKEFINQGYHFDNYLAY